MMAVGLRATLLHGGDALMQDAYAEAVNRTEIECLRLSRAAEASGDAAFDPIACRQERYAKYGADIPTPPWNAGGVVLSGAFTAGWIGGKYRGFKASRCPAGSRAWPRSRAGGRPAWAWAGRRA
ncbi:MAG: hypothetical protein H6740_02585 [Alphaproteobacteria bacterium]|nr:hypothetical protein [Alphaproteobacteria bacterium]